MNIETCINSGSIRSLYPVLSSWVEITNKYLSYFDNTDSPWWYNERASISSFAGAVWNAKGIALEEYTTAKGKTHDSWSGRCDLFIGLQSYQFACEAKQAWCPIGRKAKNGILNVKNGLKSACDDARKLDKGEGRRLGICFAVPYLPPQDNEHIENQIEEWLSSLANLEYSSIAWAFPSQARRQILTGSGYFYPGVAVIIKEVFRQTSNHG